MASLLETEINGGTLFNLVALFARLRMTLSKSPGGKIKPQDSRRFVKDP